MTEWGGINDEYELTEWETEDIYWIRETEGGRRSRFTIDPVEARALMDNRLLGSPLTDEEVKASLVGKVKEVRHGNY